MRIKQMWTISLLALVVTALSAWGWQAVLAAPPEQSVDLAQITEPQSNAVIRGNVPIMGSASHTQFQFYKVEYSREPVGGDETWGIVGAIQETPVVDGQLEVWDTTQVPDGSYSLRLRVVRLDGNYDEAVVSQIVVANTQPEEPTETPTSEISPTPTVSPTPLPATPTIVIEQPAMATDQPGTGPTRTPLPTPAEEGGTLNLDFMPLKTACLYGGGGMLAIFLLFGLIAALRSLIYAIIGRRGKWK